MPSFSACGVISITTDFGHKGPFVGTMKGVMLSHFPAARLVDLTHETLVHWPAEAGFWISRAYRFFPAGSVHVAVVDPGVGTSRDIVLIVRDGHAFLAPDNGLLAPVHAQGQCELRSVDQRCLDRLGLSKISATFHGRDIFAPVAARLASGELRPADVGPEIEKIAPSWLDEPTVSAERVSGMVLTVDHFGNLITNIEAQHVTQFPRPVVRAGGLSLRVRRTYGDCRPGEYLALINSFEVLEIARAEQSAIEGLGLSRGAPVVVTNG